MKFLSSTNELNGVSCRKCFYDSYPLHLHTNAEIIFGIDGERTVNVNNTQLRLKAGDLLILFPFQLHEYPLDEHGSGWLITAYPMKFENCREKLLTMIPSSPLISSESLSPRILSLLQLITDMPANTERREIITMLTEVLIMELFEILTLIPRTGGSIDNAEKLLTICIENCYKPAFSLNELSRDTGLSERTISRFFNESIGISFPRFISMLKLRQAINLMQYRTTITEAAFESGFNSVRTFNRAFMYEFNMTPREYIKRKMSDYV